MHPVDLLCTKIKPMMMSRKFFGLLLAALLFCVAAEAQNYQDWRRKFEDYKAQKKQQYENFKAKANAEFSEYLKRQWENYRAFRGEKAPIPDVVPEPVVLPTEDPEVKNLPQVRPDDEDVRRVDKGEVEDIPQARPEDDTQRVDPDKAKIPQARPDDAQHVDPDKAEPTPVQPVHPAVVTGKTLDVEFFGDRLTLAWPDGMTPRLGSTDEAGFSAWWERLSSVDADATLKGLSDYAARCRLNGWGYYQLALKVSEAAYADGRNSERIAMQAWLLSQLKFKAQVASCQSGLVLLLPFSEKIYNRSFIQMSGQNYYIYAYGTPEGPYRTYQNNFAYADRYLTLTMKQPMVVGLESDREVERWSRLVGEPFIVPVHWGTIALMCHHPFTDNEVYYRQQIPSDLSERVIPLLRRKIAGMNEKQSVDYLLRLVQHGFEYALDEEVFGRPKQLFVEESFFYGRNNCKDRVGVFSWLVRELLGLDVIFVRYTGPNVEVGHIATAVAFNMEVPGSSYTYKGRRYVVCDPTYINAPAGQEMPDYKNVNPELLTR